MRRRKNRERRHIWLQRELEASGVTLGGRPRRPVSLPTSQSRFAEIAVPVVTAPYVPRRPQRRPQEARLVN